MQIIPEESELRSGQTNPLVGWFEQPTNEETRICLRLEDLFSRLQECLQSDSLSSSHAAITALSQLCNATDRNDLCSKLYKLLMKQLERIESYSQSPAVNLEKLNELIQAIQEDAHQLKHNAQKTGEPLRQDPLFNNIRQQLSNPNGLATFDSPLYCLWMRQSATQRLACLKDWLQNFTLLQRVVTRSLQLLRENKEIKHTHTQRGMLEQVMNKTNPCQLVRVKVNNEPNLYPTISVGKHQLNIQLLKIDMLSQELSPAQKNYSESPLTLHFCYY